MYIRGSLFVLLVFASTVSTAQASDSGTPPIGRLAKPSVTHLLDSGQANTSSIPHRGGGPATPIPIAFPFAGPTAIPPGVSVGAFGTATGAGAFAGNLFLPGSGYPAGFLSGGATSGFSITGVFAWHWPLLKTGTMTAVTAGSTRRILAIAGASAPATASATAAVPAGYTIVTASTGLPGPSAIVGVPGNVTPAKPISTAAPAVFCSLAIGGMGFIDTAWMANGIGAVIPASPPAPPTRLGYPAMFFGIDFPISAVTFSATPQTQIAGCYAAGATTPVELQAYRVD